MSAEAFDAGGLSVRDALLATAEHICEREQRSLIQMGGLMVGWVPPKHEDIFPVPLKLEEVALQTPPEEGAFSIAQARFWIGGDLESSMIVSATMEDDLNDDPIAPDILATFQQSYSVHSHMLCFRALRERRQMELRRARIMMARHQHEPKSKPAFRVTDHRHSMRPWG